MKSAKSEVGKKVLDELNRKHPTGMTSAQIVDFFVRQGEAFSEATFRKWVQLGLLPRSRRVGRKGKHQGSRGIYPVAVVGRIAEVKQMLAEHLTIEDAQRAFRLRDEVEAIDRALDHLWDGLKGAIHDPAVGAEARGDSLKRFEEAHRLGRKLIESLNDLERRIVSPLVRAARARAFGAGAGGGAGDLL